MGNEKSKDSSKEDADSKITDRLEALRTFFLESKDSSKEDADSKITDRLELLRTGDKSDVTLECGSANVRVHSDILSAQSDVFRALTDELGDDKTIRIANIAPSTLKSILHFMYSGKLQAIPIESVMKVYEGAEIYQVESLIDKCKDIIKEKLSEINVCDVLIFSDLRQGTYLKNEVISYLMERKSFLLSHSWRKFCDIHSQLATEVHLEFIRRTQ